MSCMDRGRDTPEADTVVPETRLYFEIDNFPEESTTGKVSSGTEELATELAEEAYIESARADRYCLTPGIARIYRDFIEISITTDPTVTPSMVADRLSSRLQNIPELNHIQTGSEKIPLSEDLDDSQLAQALQEVWKK